MENLVKDLIGGLRLEGWEVVFITFIILTLVVILLQRLLLKKAPSLVSVEDIPAPAEVRGLEDEREDAIEVEEMAAAAVVGMYLAMEEQGTSVPPVPRQEPRRPSAWRMQGRELLMRGRGPRNSAWKTATSSPSLDKPIRLG
ncbi:MAG: hypothetical protein HY666_03420 [Chloroflexi bacterium]|nr:hypothetical protein [Chloroflexota bacterium]